MKEEEITLSMHKNQKLHLMSLALDHAKVSARYAQKAVECIQVVMKEIEKEESK